MAEHPPKWTLDANIVLRYLLGDDEELSAKARTILHAVADGRVDGVCDPVVLSEVVYVLSSVYEMPREAISEALISLLGMEHIVIADRQRYIHALRLFGESVRHFGDACACATALAEGDGRLFSFDRKIADIKGLRRAEEFSGPSE